MKRTLINNVRIVNEGIILKGSVLIEDERIAVIYPYDSPRTQYDEKVEGDGCYLLPGVIDEHVHFREPGLTEKADILSESKAAAAGGVTSIMDMPNTLPQTTTLEALEEKFSLMQQKCIVNYSCYFGATHDNHELFQQLDKSRVCGIKLFMGSSTGNMLVDDKESLVNIFRNARMLVAVHCESQDVISKNMQKYMPQAIDGDLPIALHSRIRSSLACFLSTKTAVMMAHYYGTRLHIAHISTARELTLLHDLPLERKFITAEVCIPHLMFTNHDYPRLGARIKCNPSVKRESDRATLLEALNSNYIDTIATDHAPHLLIQKQGGALQAVSGMPMVQYSLNCMLELVDEGVISIKTLVQKMCHNPARLFRISNRGFIREGYYADLVMVRPNTPWTVKAEDIQSKCGWSPLEGHTFYWKVERTFVNGQQAYSYNEVDTSVRGKELSFRTNG